MKIRKLRALRHIRRFNFHHCNRPTSVAEHSFFVALIAMELFPNDPTVLEAALLHDAEEACTGDIGHLIRKRLDMKTIDQRAAYELGLNMRDAGHRVNDAVMLCDLVELKIYLEEERMSGNLHLSEIESEVMGGINYLCQGFCQEMEKKVKSLIKIVRPSKDTDKLTHEGEQWQRSQ